MVFMYAAETMFALQLGKIDSTSLLVVDLVSYLDPSLLLFLPCSVTLCLSSYMCMTMMYVASCIVFGN